MDDPTAPTRLFHTPTARTPVWIARGGAWLAAHPRAAALLLYGFALAVRLPYWAYLQRPEGARAPFMDEAFYFTEAWNIVRGAPSASDAYFMTPLYPWFLSVVFRIFGDAPTAAYGVQLLLGSAVAPLVWLAGRRVARTWTAFWAALATATFAPFTLFESLYLVEWSIGLALALALTITLAAPRRAGWAIAAGACIGIATLGRGTNLLLVPLFAAWYAMPRSITTRAGAWRQAIACVLGCAVVLAPLALRNLRHAEQPLFLTANLGFNLWVGNGPDANGIFVRVPGLDLQQDPLTTRYVQRRLRRAVTASETSTWWAARTRAWVREHPQRTAQLFLWKLVLFWNRQSIPQVEGFEIMAVGSPLSRPPFWRSFAFLPLALLCSVACFAAWRPRERAASVLPPDVLDAMRDRRDARLLLAASAWVYAGSIALFFVTDRYRLPILPFLILLAAIAVETMLAWSRAEHRRRLPFALAAVAATFFITDPARLGIDRDRMRRDLFVHAALRAAESGRFDEALARYDRARRIDPTDADVLDGYARMLSRAGRDRDAMEQYRRLLTAHPDDARAWYNFGNSHRRAGRDSAALAAYQKALALEPEREAAWNQLGEVYRTLGDTARAADAYQSALALAPAHEQALNNLAALRARQGHAADAEAGFRAAQSANPRYVPALVNLALLLGDQNPETARLWRDVLAVDPDNAVARDHAQRLGLQLPPASRRDVP